MADEIPGGEEMVSEGSWNSIAALREPGGVSRGQDPAPPALPNDRQRAAESGLDVQGLMCTRTSRVSTCQLCALTLEKSH